MSNNEMVSVPRDELEQTIKVLRYAAHPLPSPHADHWEEFLRKPVIEHQVEPVKLNFPTMLRKMWSGGEVQRWLDEHGPLYRYPDGRQHGDSAIPSTENDGGSGDLSTNQNQDEHPIQQTLREHGQEIAERAAEMQRKTLRDAGFCTKCHGSRMIRGTYGHMPCDECC